VPRFRYSHGIYKAALSCPAHARRSPSPRDERAAASRSADAQGEEGREEEDRPEEAAMSDENPYQAPKPNAEIKKVSWARARVILLVWFLISLYWTVKSLQNLVAHHAMVLNFIVMTISLAVLLASSITFIVSFTMKRK
jgi:hypothetical protein